MRTILYLGADFGLKAAKEVVSTYAEIAYVPSTKEAVKEAIVDCYAILDASMKVRITDDMIVAAKNLRVISCATTGADHIDLLELNKRGISLLTLSEDKELLQNITPAAELSWALLMACARKLPSAFDHVKAGGWSREDFPGVMLKGKPIGIIGCGRIGGWMSRYAQAFGMISVGYDPYIHEFPLGVRSVSLEELLRTSDIVTIHVPLNEETQGLLSADCLEKIKPGAILINTSRGGVIDEIALLKALESGRLSAAGLDVLVGEPDIDSSPLVRYARTNDNLIITPHCGGFSPDAVALVCKRAAEKILEYI